MKKFVGTKLIKARPMTRLEYNSYRGWNVPSDENPNDEGYLVEYEPGDGTQNHPNHLGYISWSPKTVFDCSYYNIETGISFGQAVDLMLQGYKVQRKSWNPTNIFIFFRKPEKQSVKEVNTRADTQIEGYFAMRNDCGEVRPFTPSHTDMRAVDWVAVKHCAGCGKTPAEPRPVQEDC